ncbi:MAG: EF-Tu/IF-2/RF-3 family GTPase, partial [Victivallaceae bacterium]
ELMSNIISLFPNPLDKGSVTLADGEKEPVSETGPGQALIFKSVIDPFIGHLIFFKIVSGSFKSDSEVFNISSDNKERFGQMMVMNGKEQKTVTELGPGCIGAIAKLKTAHIGNTFGTTHTVKALPPIIFPNPVMSYSVAAVKSGEEDKIATGLHKIAESDPTVHLKRQDETHELLLSGMGDQHLAHVIKKLKETYKVDVHLDTPKIPYRESITANGEGHYKHKKQTGGAGQFAEVFLRISPNEPGHEFVNDVVGGNIPKNFIPAVEKGVHDAMIKGPLVGCVVERIKVSVYDGKYHPVDSNEMAFKIAGRMAFRDAMSKAHPVLLEPIMKVKVSIPDQYMGDITGDLNHKRGRILGMGMQEGMQVVKAEIPQVEMSKYATELRSMTHGRGSFSMEFDRYEQVPSNVANEIISKYEAAQEEE